MPLTLVTVTVSVVVSSLRGGRVARIGEADLQGMWLLGTGFALQFMLATKVAAPAEGPASAMLLTSHALVLAWAASNWWRPGMRLVVLGLVCNAAVIAANGAMPVDPGAIRSLGVEVVEIGAAKHELMHARTHLAWLGDVLPIVPIRTVVSVGDVLLAAGLVPLVHHLMTGRAGAARHGGRRVGDLATRS